MDFTIKLSMKISKEKNLNTQSVLAMRDSGYYSQRTIGAKIAIDNMLPLMENALKEDSKTAYFKNGRLWQCRWRY